MVRWPRLALSFGLATMFASSAMAEQAPRRAIPCSEASPPPAVPYEVQLRQNLPIELSPQTTFQQISAALGSLHRYGPDREMYEYEVRVPPDLRLVLWLSFENVEPRRLTRAILHSWERPYCPAGAMTILVNSLDITRNRRRDQLDYSRRLSKADVYAAWGPPDGQSGFGLSYWHYTMADGEVVALVYDREGHVIGSGERQRRRRR